MCMGVKMNCKHIGQVSITAWVDPVLRDYARSRAKREGMELSAWVARAVQRAVAYESARSCITNRSDDED